MSRVLIIGCGGVATVAIHKCCQVSEVFTEICIASRTKEKCDKILSIPLLGSVNSLNASVALGIAAYEVVRNRLK